MTKNLKLTEIITDAGTQVRVGLNEATVADYAEALAAGAKFPPITVFDDGSRHLAADGFHRIQAASRSGAPEIECDIREGSKADALKFALGSNADHGLRRTNADKRHAVGMAFKEFPTLSDRALAELCLVGHTFVADVRRSQLESDSSSTANRSQSPSAPRIGRDGVKRRLPPPPMKRGASTVTIDPKGTTAIKSRLATTSPPLPCTEASTTTGEPSAGAVKPHMPPPPPQVLDGTGCPIPTQLIPLWQRADEVQELLKTLSRVRGALRTAQDSNDKLFGEVNFSSALSQLDQARTNIKTAKPFAVCPTCQGQLPDPCTFCKGRGFISEHRWNNCVTREDKEFRFKARQPNLPLG